MHALNDQIKFLNYSISKWNICNPKIIKKTNNNANHQTKANHNSANKLVQSKQYLQII